jgi:UDP-N-acetylmuramate--alanine ligase
VRVLLDQVACRKVTFGLSEENDWHPKNLKYDEKGRGSFDVCYHDETVGHVDLSVAGFFHVMNALACLACAHTQHADVGKAAAALSRFSGAHRRFEHTSTIDGVDLFHDYGHNPAEMRNILSVAVMQPHRRLWAVMQPHTYSRVKALLHDYFTCTEAADITLVTDIYAAREKDPGDIKAEQIVEGMRAHGINAIHTPTFDDTERYLREHWQEGDLVLTMGCGNINQLNDQMWAHEQGTKF